MIPEMPFLCPENLGSTEPVLADQQSVAAANPESASADGTLAGGRPARENAEVETLLVTVSQAQKMLSCCKTKIFSLINEGVLERRKLGSKATRITTRSIRRLAER